MEGKIHTCTPCNSIPSKASSKQRAGLLMAVMLAVLPKCPFCIVAYSSTMVLCSGETLPFNHVHASPLTLAITAVLGLITLSCILLRFRDKRTIYAFLLALAGMAMVFYSVAGSWTAWLYYGGVVVVFLGIWLNASLLNYVGKITAFLSGNHIPN